MLDHIIEFGLVNHSLGVYMLLIAIILIMLIVAFMSWVMTQGNAHTLRSKELYIGQEVYILPVVKVHKSYHYRKGRVIGHVVTPVSRWQVQIGGSVLSLHADELRLI